MALKDIIGQEKALRIFFGTLKRSRVPSAMLLSGDAGIGKKLSAINYAKAINCLNPVNHDACDDCRACRKIDSGTHPDVTALLPEGDEIKIDDIRKLEEVLFLKPFEGKKKIVIIDDADTMNSNAANAFLKTLEEPPDDSLILLVASNPDRLPDTIRSRCINVRFYPLPAEGFKKVIAKNVKADDMDVVLRLSMGRPGLALSGDFADEKERFMKFLDNMLHGESKDAWTDKDAIRSWLDMSSIFLRDIVVFNITGSESDLICVMGRHKAFKNIPASNVFDAYQSLQKLRGLLDFNLNKSISWNYAAAIMRKCVTG